MGRERPRGDDGYSLIELMVVMVVMTFVMSIFTTMILMLYRTVNNVENKSVGQTQIATAMQRLDREVRYAKGISLVYSVGGSPYVDFLAVQQGTATCNQVRLTGGVLAQRTWPYSTSGTPSPTVWVALASGVTTTAPFTYLAPSSTTGYQQLQVTLKVGNDENSATFTALNSTRATSNDYCAGLRS